MNPVGNGRIVFHTLGARAVVLAGSVTAVAVGAGGARVGLGTRRSVTSIALGTAGLPAFPLFTADALTGRIRNTGMLERAVIYPVTSSRALPGSSLAIARRAAAPVPTVLDPRTTS
ncbi:hypothetical protein [Streptomyces spinosus]|uniref:hypothetical protein n=1 Tax=Streptomyces spinosus TaxID=2872623 RepID=UPI001CECC98C|nr:hypothetical protein [Streptomyces spinosus]